MLRVDPGSPTPPFEQVRAQLAEQVRSGELDPGTRLPAVRRLAGDLGISPGTVARAYRELEQAGLVTTSRRGGTVVADDARAGVAGPAADLARESVARLRGMGLDDASILQAVRGALAEG